MSTTAVTTPPGGPRPRRTASPARIAARTLGELMITFGMILLLLVVYQLWYTNIQANRAQDAIKDDLREAWSVGSEIKGRAIGIMYIKRLGDDWAKPVVEGVDLDDLSKGVGHFPDSAGPGELGNFAVAAHRATHGEPFAYLDEIRVGDEVVLETRNRWFVYTVEKMPGGGSEHPAWKLVDPSYGDVVLPVPEQPGVVPTEKRITLVTCNPRWGSTTRLIVYGTLTTTYKKPSDTLPPELAYTAEKT